jgi:hypothetical protein
MILRIGGNPPDERQRLVIDHLIRAEWAAIVAEHEAVAATDARTRVFAMKVTGDARKQVLLWHRELNAATRPPKPAEPEPIDDPLLALRKHFARRAS